MMRYKSCFVLCFLMALMIAVGCGKVPASISVEELLANPDVLHERLKESNPAYKGGAMVADQPQVGLVAAINVGTVSDISALRGIPFVALDLRGTLVEDIGPLRGMPLVMLGLEGTQVINLDSLKGAKLQKLYLNDTAVVDIKPLKGMPLEELMLVNTKVSDIASLKGAPLKMLWVNNAPVSGVEAIASCPLVSLTLEGSQVSDLSPLAGHKTLKRLHIGQTKVTDLTPLKDIRLQRLIFTSSNIEKGMEVVKEMESLREIGTTLQGKMSPQSFWEGQ